MTKVLRINARIDRQTAQKIARVRKSTGKSTSAIITEAIGQLQEPAPKKTTAELFGDFIGCFSGEPSLSKNYKQEVAKIIDKKHAHHR